MFSLTNKKRRLKGCGGLDEEAFQNGGLAGVLLPMLESDMS